MKFEFDKEDIDKAAEVVYKTMKAVQHMMETEMSLDKEHVLRTMVVSAYQLGVKHALEKVNRSLE